MPGRNPDPLDSAPRTAMPSAPEPMLATLTDERFSDKNWLFEKKWDGVRCLAFRDENGRVGLRSRNDLVLDDRYREVAAAVRAQVTTSAVLDGEVVAFRGKHSSFEELQQRDSNTKVFYYVFDLLYLDGHDVRELPLRERKRLLRDHVQFGGPLRFTAHRNEAGEEEYRKACERGDEGVIAKRADAPYRPGRSKDWLKFKCVRNQELVIGGFTDPKGSRAAFGALLVGYFDGDDFVYAGKVGTGFDDKMLRDLHQRMTRIERSTPPFTRGRLRVPRDGSMHFVEPELVAQFGFTEWTRDGMLRHPRYEGLRDDKAAREVVRETR
jgi:bifunctional non-homologous end joining protein LigD